VKVDIRMKTCCAWRCFWGSKNAELQFTGFRIILHGKYVPFDIEVYAVTRVCLIVQNAFFCEIKSVNIIIYEFYMLYTKYTVIFTLYVFKLCIDLLNNSLICSVS
jgi:hypothetical protein